MPVLMLVPTGIGCSIGGYAGDAIPSARLLAAACGCLITHPNVMNAASLYWSDNRIQYVEGYAIDRFAAGELFLHPVRQQKIGLLLDSGLEKDLYYRHLQVADGCRASLGLNIGPIVKTDVPLDISLKKGLSGASWGEIGQPEALLSAGDRLKQLGATAIAVVSRFPDDCGSQGFEQYRSGKGVDSLAGAEAVISHLLVRHLSIPCAHAPALSPLPVEPHLDPRAAAEDIGYTFLPSVLTGLSRAPDLILVEELNSNNGLDISFPDCIKSNDLGAVVVPDGALGGDAVLSCIERDIPLIVVSNPAVINVSSKSLKIADSEALRNGRILYAANYLEAAGLVLALREGVTISSIKRPLESLQLDSQEE